MVVNPDQIIVAAAVTQDPNDGRRVRPMVLKTLDTLQAAGVQDNVGTVVAHGGYWTERALRRAPAHGVIVPVPPYSATQRITSPDRPAPKPSM